MLIALLESTRLADVIVGTQPSSLSACLAAFWTRSSCRRHLGSSERLSLDSMAIEPLDSITRICLAKELSAATVSIPKV